MPFVRADKPQLSIGIRLPIPFQSATYNTNANGGHQVSFFASAVAGRAQHGNSVQKQPHNQRWQGQYAGVLHL